MEITVFKIFEINSYYLPEIFIVSNFYSNNSNLSTTKNNIDKDIKLFETYIHKTIVHFIIKLHFVNMQ